MVNSNIPIDFSSPFGGYKASGVGREFGEDGLELFLEKKTINLPAGYTPDRVIGPGRTGRPHPRAGRRLPEPGAGEQGRLGRAGVVQHPVVDRDGCGPLVCDHGGVGAPSDEGPHATGVPGGA
jgi:hypothetical protein